MAVCGAGLVSSAPPFAGLGRLKSDVAGLRRRWGARGALSAPEERNMAGGGGGRGPREQATAARTQDGRGARGHIVL